MAYFLKPWADFLKPCQRRGPPSFSEFSKPHNASTFSTLTHSDSLKPNNVSRFGSAHLSMWPETDKCLEVLTPYNPTSANQALGWFLEALGWFFEAISTRRSPIIFRVFKSHKAGQISQKHRNDCNGPGPKLIKTSRLSHQIKLKPSKQSHQIKQKHRNNRKLWDQNVETVAPNQTQNIETVAPNRIKIFETAANYKIKTSKQSKKSIWMSWVKAFRSEYAKTENAQSQHENHWKM